MKLSMFLNDIKKYISSYKNSQDTDNAECNIGEIINCPVYVINLERSNLRRDFILRYLSSLGIEAKIFNAVEGSKLNISELEEKNIYDNDVALEAFSRPLSLPEIGCSLSHIGIYHKIVDENIEKVLIIEDDVIFIEGIAEYFSSILKNVPEDWDIIQLYYKCQDFEKITNNIVKFRSKKCFPAGSAGYFINRSGAEKMLKNVYPVRYPADSLLARSPRWDIILYGSLPSLLNQNYLFPTEIQTRSNLSSSLRDAVKNLIIKTISRFLS